MGGGTDGTLTLSNVAPADAGMYGVVVSNPYGSVTGAPVQLAVSVVPLTISSNPADQVATNGDTVELSVSAAGSPPVSYQWYFQGTNALAQGTNATLSLTNVSVAQAGLYQVEVSNPYNTLTSAPAQLTVVVPALILSGPAGVVATNGDNVLLSVVAQGSEPLVYQWYFQGTNALAQGTNASLSLSLVGPEQAGLYGVVVSNAYGVSSNGASLVVIVLPTINCGTYQTIQWGVGWDFTVPVVTGSNTTLTILSTQTNLGCGPSYSVSRGWLVTDGAGYQATCTQTVQVVDTLAPVLNCAGDKSVVLGSGWDFDAPVGQAGGVVGALVYDNWTNDLGGGFVPGSVEVGNQVTLGGEERYIRRFGFGYWGSNTVAGSFAGVVQARVRFYNNDGPVVGAGPGPGTVLYDSGLLDLAATNNGSVEIEDFQLGSTVVPLVGRLPESLTWSVQFSGLTNNDTAGLSLFGPPVVGQARTQFWENGANGWVQRSGIGPADFGAQLEAVGQGVALSVLSTVTNATCGNGYSAARAWQAVDACGNVATCTQTVAVVDQSPPTIVGQPQDALVAKGETVTFSAGISACPPLTYQWYFNESNSLPNGTDASLVLPSVTTNETGSYLVVVSNAYGSATSAPAQLSVALSAPIVSAPADQAATNGDTVIFSVTAHGAQPLSYQWYFNGTNSLATGTAAALGLSNVVADMAGAYEVVVTNDYGSVTSAPARLTVAVPVTLLTGPSDQLATNGDTVLWSVTASGSQPLGYQWYFNSMTLPAGTNATLTVSNVTPAQAGSYAVIVSNPYSSATSAAAQLSVVVPALIVTGPTNVVATNGGTVTLVVVAQGTAPLGYQWYFDLTNSLDSQTNASLVLSNVTPAIAGAYTVNVTNAYNSVTSGPAQLSVVVPPSILTGPLDQTATNGDTVSFGVTAGGDAPISYQWFFSGAIASGSTNATIVLTNVSLAQVGAYNVVASNPFGSATSAPAQLTVVVPAFISGDPTNQLATNGDTVWFSVEAHGSPPLSYQWYFNLTNTLGGATNATLVLSNVSPSNIGAYAVVVSNPYNTLTSAPAQLSVVLPPTIVTDPANQVVTNGDSANFTVAAAGDGPLAYQWFFEGTNGLAQGTNAILTLSRVGASQAGDYNAVVSSPYGSATSAPALLKVIVPAIILADPTNQVAALGDTVLLVVIAGGSEPMSYQWYFNSTNSLDFGTNAILVLSNAIPSDAGLYQVAVANPYAAVTSAPAQLTVIAPARILSGPGDQVATNGGTVTFQVTAQGDAPLAYQWFFEGTSLLTGATSSSLTLNPVSPADSGPYTVTVSNLYNTVTSAPALLSVVSPVQILSDPTNQVATNGDTVLFVVAAQGGSPLAYQWFFEVTNSVDGGTNATLVLTNVSTVNAGDYQVLVSNPYNTVTSAPAQLSVVVPALILDEPTNAVVSTGGTATFTVSAEGDAPLTFQWYFDTTNLLASGTNASLVLTNVNFADVGDYVVVVSNAYNSVTSSPATLVVADRVILLSGPTDLLATNGDDVSFSVSAAGSPPVSYQWYFQGTNALAQGTNATLSLTNVSVAQAGLYQVEVSNPYNTLTSAPAQLTVVVPALILSGPAGVVATNGDNVLLSVVAQGSEPLVYQWYFQGTNALAQGTNASLSLSLVGPEQAGLYGVVVSNAYGVSSNGASLVVIVLPTINCGTYQTIQWGVGWDFTVPVVTGSNTTLTILSTQTNLGCGPSYSVSRGWLVTDGAGYQATCTQTVQVVDTLAPVLNCAGDKSVVLGSGWDFDAPVGQAGGVVGALVYDNWTNDLGGGFVPGSVEVGNQVTLGGEERYIRRFGFGYWGSNTVAGSFAGVVQARVRFYNNDGPVVGAGPGPGTVLYDSGLLDLAATNNGSVEIEDFQLGSTVVPLVGRLPESLTWSVQFSGLTNNDTAGLSLFGPPVVGQVQTNSYWENGGQGWMLQTNLPGSDFGAQFEAVGQGVALSVLSTVTNATCGNGYSAARAWQAVDACGNVATCTQTVAVVDQGPPTIVGQPQDESVPAGQTATLTVGVSSCPPLTYQWYFNQTNPVTGGTNAALVLDSLANAQAGGYEAVVSNPYGNATSAPAQITVVLPLTISSDPTDQVVNAGDTAVFAVAAQGAGLLGYQWYFNQSAALPGATNTTLALTNVSLAQAGLYQVVVSNSFESLTSAPARLTVAMAVQILGGPLDQTATNGDTVALTVDAVGTPPLTYQWYFDQSNSLASGTDATLTLSGVTPVQAGVYEVVVSNAYGSATSPPAQLSVVVPAGITAGPASQVATNGDTVNFSVAAQGTTPLGYQWYFQQTQALAGATGSVLSLNGVTTNQAGSYAVVVTNAYASVTSAPALLTVVAPPAIVAGPDSQVVTNGATVIFAVLAQGTAPLIYQWYFNATNAIGGATNTSLALASVTNGNDGGYSVTISNAYGGALSAPATLRVLVPARLVSFSRSQNVVSLTFSTVPNLFYSVYYNDNLGTTNWIALPKATLLPGTGSPITLQDPRANVEYRFYKIVVQ